MVQSLQRTGVPRALAPEEQFLQFVMDDTEEAPWMSMNDAQWHVASTLYSSLRVYSKERQLGWYVGGMLPMYYYRPDTGKEHPVAPDMFVAFVPDRPRQSYNVREEGGMPPFVVEVVSPSSAIYDSTAKRALYEWLGVEEFVLFTPGSHGEARMTGDRRGDDGKFTRWVPDEQGRLWSSVLGLYVLVLDDELRAQERDGRMVPTHLEEAQLRRHEENLRREAQAEVARLRAEIERLRG